MNELVVLSILMAISVVFYILWELYKVNKEDPRRRKDYKDK